MVRVLIADADPSLREIVGQRLRVDGVHVDVCASGEDALERLCETRFDVAVLEIQPCDTDGLEVLRTVRAKGIRTSVVITTREATKHQETRAMQAGAQEYVQKPVEPGRLVGSIQCLLEARRFPPCCLAKSLDSYLRRNLGRASLNLEELCQHFRISHGYACRLFRTHLGASFRERLTGYRVQQAKHLLETTNQPMYIIAEECGLKSPCRLTDLFRTTEGLPPRRYREVHQYRRQNGESDAATGIGTVDHQPGANRR